MTKLIHGLRGRPPGCPPSLSPQILFASGGSRGRAYAEVGWQAGPPKGSDWSKPLVPQKGVTYLTDPSTLTAPRVKVTISAVMEPRVKVSIEVVLLPAAGEALADAVAAAAGLPEDVPGPAAHRPEIKADGGSADQRAIQPIAADRPESDFGGGAVGCSTVQPVAAYAAQPALATSMPPSRSPAASTIEHEEVITLLITPAEDECVGVAVALAVDQPAEVVLAPLEAAFYHGACAWREGGGGSLGGRGALLPLMEGRGGPPPL